MAGLRRLIAAAAVAVLVGAACDGDGTEPRSTGRSGLGPTTSAVPPHSVERPRGGTVRVGVWAAPDVGAPGLGGAAVRALVYPQAFTAQPDGSWAASIVEPGSDRTSADARSASFRLRAGAKWTDGSPIAADDLRRSADGRFVAGIDEPAADGTITVHFTQPLPGWHRLWSLTDSIAPPAAGLWGGPFVVASATPGLETVLHRNDGWVGGPGPFVDELRLVLVPNVVTARQLLARGELDVVMPPAYTARTRQFEGLQGVTVQGADPGGWWVGMLLNPERLDHARRRAVVATVDRRTFAAALLDGEAVVVDGLTSQDDPTWSAPGDGDLGGLKDRNVEVVGLLEEPMTPLLQRSMQKQARRAGGTLEMRNAEADRVEGWLADRSFDAAIVMLLDAPLPCWRCRWDGVDTDLARRADAGDPAAASELQAKVRDEAVAVPLWRPRTLVASRRGVAGVKPNGYAVSPAWNAWEWWREAR